MKSSVPAVIGVAMKPGAMALRRTPRPIHASAVARRRTHRPRASLLAP
jgi:hypothetical protein